MTQTQRLESEPLQPAIDMHGVEDQIGFVLRLAQLAVFKDIYETLSPLGLRPSDFSALRVIAANPGLKQQDIGRELGIKRPNLVGLVDELDKKNLVLRKVVRGDRRSYQTRLREALGANDPRVLLECLRALTQLGGAPTGESE
jgi:DNA-binding MarR family transcriptional regulator